MNAPTPIVIDTDIGSDPDDALALILALASPELDVRGITIVSGDVALRARIASRLLGLAGRPDIPIHMGRGASAADGLAPTMDGAEGRGILDLPWHGPEAAINSMPAAEFLVEEARARPFYLVAIGPLSNVAAAIADDAGFANRLLGLTIMGGLLDLTRMPAAWQLAVEARGMAAWPDYNTMTDPAAALIVAHAGRQPVWVTLDATMRAPLRQASRDRLPPDRPLGVALGRAIDAWHDAWFPSALPAPFDRAPVPADAVAILHDPLAVAAVFAGTWIHPRQTRLTYVMDDGAFRLREEPGGSPATVVDSIDGARFEAFCVERIARYIARFPP